MDWIVRLGSPVGVREILWGDMAKYRRQPLSVIFSPITSR